MKAVILSQIKQPLTYSEIDTPELPTDRHVLLRVSAAAINHRDVYISQGLYAAIKTPAVLGSDVAGEVVACGAAVDAAIWQGQKVVVNPNINWGDDERVQGKDYQVLGMPSQGTFAEYITVNVDRLALAPTHLTMTEAAALPLAGLTAYRALLVRAQASAGDRVLISGIGGGVALFALQFAVALGLETWVTSSSDEKIARAVALGAKGGANYKNENWHKDLAAAAGGNFDVVIDSAGGEGFAKFIDIANPAARIAFYGGTHGKFSLSPQKLFWKQISVLGSTMGSDADFVKMMQLIDNHKVVPIVDSVWAMPQAQEAFDYMHNAQQFGKIILQA